MKHVFLAFTVVLLLCNCKKDTQKNTPNTAAAVVFAPAITAAAADFKGVNWADARDNFADDALLLSGTANADDYAAILAKSATILNGFKNAGANTVRLPVNPATVSTEWWKRYKAAIDKATDLGMKVVLAYWEGASSKDGKIDNGFSYWKMWDTVTTAYSTKGNVYFEVFNEPHGYNLTELKELYAQFLSRYSTMPKSRIVLDGAGYATDVNGVGDDHRFDSCLLSFHFYTWFDADKKTTADWEQTIHSLSYPSRTIVTEFGVPMSSDKDYIAAPGNDREITYLQGMTNAINEVNVGCVYWPGLRTGDTYSMFTLSGSGMVAGNATGLSRLRFAWHQEDIAAAHPSFTNGAFYKIINKNSNKSLDVNNSSLDNGGAIIQWEYWGGDNQQWKLNVFNNGYFSISNKNSNKLLDVDSNSTVAGKNIIQWGVASNTSQLWQITDIGFGYYKLINQNSNLSLDVNGASIQNGSNIIQWYWNGGANQQWQITNL